MSAFVNIPVGAGDSFTATFISALLMKKSVREAHQLAVNVSAFVCTQHGMRPRVMFDTCGRIIKFHVAFIAERDDARFCRSVFPAIIHLFRSVFLAIIRFCKSVFYICNQNQIVCNDELHRHSTVIEYVSQKVGSYRLEFQEIPLQPHQLECKAVRYLDEVHKFGNWTTFIKNIYDNYPDLNIVYTGSAMLAIDNSKSDLSRRQSLYTLRGLSFREYLEYESVISLPSLSLEELLATHTHYAMEVTARIKVLKYFENYLNGGYYPYYKEAGKDYLMRIGEVVQLVIDSDIPAVEETITYATRQKIKKLLMVVAENVPLEPNINKLASSLESTRDQTLKMLYWLDRAALLDLLTDKAKDYKHLTGPKKIYLENTNLMSALGNGISKGTQRETFFANQVGSVATLLMSKQGDF